MPVVFDQVVGTVASETTDSGQEAIAPPTSTEPEIQKFCRLFRQKDRRAARLRTD